LLTVDALTGEESSAAIKGFAMVGLVPFTKNVLVDDIHGAATAYVDRVKKEGQDGQPVLPKPLALSHELVPNSFPPLQQTWQPSTCRSSSLVRGVARAPKVRVASQLLTGTTWLTREAEDKATKAAEESVKAARTVERKAAAVADKAVKSASAEKRAQKAAQKAAQAAVAPEHVGEVAAPAQAARKRRREGEGAVEGARKPV
jgi:hypothetical protein